MKAALITLVVVIVAVIIAGYVKKAMGITT